MEKLERKKQPNRHTWVKTSVFFTPRLLAVLYFCLINLDPVPTNSEIFETAHFFTRLRVDGALNHSGERLKKHTVLVSGFTGG